MEGLGDTFGKAAKLTIRAGDHDDIAIGLAKPKLKVVCERIDVKRLEDLSSSFDGAFVGVLDTFAQEPQRYTVAIWLDFLSAQIWMFVSIPEMELQHQRSLRGELLVLRAAMRTDEPERALEPSA